MGSAFARRPPEATEIDPQERRGRIETASETCSAKAPAQTRAQFQQDRSASAKPTNSSRQDTAEHSFRGMVTLLQQGSAANLKCYPCPRTPVTHVSGLYTTQGWGTRRFFGVRRPPRGAAATCSTGCQAPWPRQPAVLLSGLRASRSAGRSKGPATLTSTPKRLRGLLRC